MEKLIRALGLLDMGQHRRAADELREFLADYPQNGSAHATLASCLLQDGQIDDALTHAQTAVGLDPSNPHSHVVLSCVLAEKKEHKLSREAVQCACEIAPYNASYWGLLGIRNLHTFRLKDALQACEKGLEIDPTDSNSWSCRTSLLFFQGRADEAISASLATLAQDAESAAGHMMCGLSLMHAGRVKEAEDSFYEALRIEPENIHAQRLLRATQGLERFVFKGLGALRDGPQLWLLPILTAWILLTNAMPEVPDDLFLPLAIALTTVRLLLLCSLIIPSGLSVIFSLALRQVDWPRAGCWFAGLVLWSLPDLTDRFPEAPILAVLVMFCSLSFHLSSDGRRGTPKSCRASGWSLLLATLLLGLLSLTGVPNPFQAIALGLGSCWCIWYVWYCLSAPRSAGRESAPTRA